MPNVMLRVVMLSLVNIECRIFNVILIVIMLNVVIVIVVAPPNIQRKD